MPPKVNLPLQKNPQLQSHSSIQTDLVTHLSIKNIFPTRTPFQLSKLLPPKKKHQSPISHRAMTRQAHRSNKE